MYIHIGGEYQLPRKLIIAIIDIEQTKSLDKGSINEVFLALAEKNDMVELIDVDLPKSIVITLEKVYLSPISASTLRRRLKSDKMILPENTID